MQDPAPRPAHGIEFSLEFALDVTRRAPLAAGESEELELEHNGVSGKSCGEKSSMH